MRESAVSFEFIEGLKAKLTESEFIEYSENRYKRQIKSVVDSAIADGVRVIRLAGPSGSGKTTSAKLIMQEIRDRGIPSYYMSMDNWYKTLKVEDLPINEDGDPDFESPELLDVSGFKNDVYHLLRGDKVNLRVFDFKNRISTVSDEYIQSENNGIIVIEGIHAINPMFDVDGKVIKVYVEPTDVEFGDGLRITSSNIRLCRRIHRDMVDRGMSASDTIKKCTSVDRGQQKYIEPYTHGSDVIEVDTLLLYELYIHKNEMPDNEYLKSVELSDISRLDIPNDSILREFYKQ